MELLLLFAFLSGLVTIFAPCIWPLLPIILSASTSGGHKKPLGITVGIISSFALITLTISYIVSIIPFNPDALRYFAVVIIGFLGLSLVIPALSQKLEGAVSRLSGKVGMVSKPGQNGFWSGFVTGAALGIVWTPCAGPILATIATLAATQAVNFQIVLVTIVYVIGVGIPLFIFATVGSALFNRSRVLSKYTGQIQQVFGVIMILTAVAIATNYDKVLQVKLLDAFPSYGKFLNDFENNDAVQEQLDELKGQESIKTIGSDITGEEVFNADTPARDFVGINNWLNSEPLTMEQLKGKVVLVDFWTYTCINCIRTLPYVTSWYEKYKDQGFVVVGVHTPEFEFEKDTKNVQDAINQYEITYPVAQDNDYATWRNYSNRYWPAHYLVDAEGTIRRVHFGEGEYEETERAIQLLLEEAGQKVSSDLEADKKTLTRYERSPETYLGSDRMQYYFPSQSLKRGTDTYTMPAEVPTNQFSLGGSWTINREEAISGKNATLKYHFTGNKVHLVIRPGEAGAGAKIAVKLDGKVIDAQLAGDDVKDGIITIDTDRLYNIVDLRDNPGDHVLELEFQTPGIEAFAFTFG